MKGIEFARVRKEKMRKLQMGRSRATILNLFKVDDMIKKDFEEVCVVEKDRKLKRDLDGNVFNSNNGGWAETLNGDLK